MDGLEDRPADPEAPELLDGRRRQAHALHALDDPVPGRARGRGAFGACRSDVTFEEERRRAAPTRPGRVRVGALVVRAAEPGDRGGELTGRPRPQRPPADVLQERHVFLHRPAGRAEHYTEGGSPVAQVAVEREGRQLGFREDPGDARQGLPRVGGGLTEYGDSGDVTLITMGWVPGGRPLLRRRRGRRGDTSASPG